MYIYIYINHIYIYADSCLTGTLCGRPHPPGPHGGGGGGGGPHGSGGPSGLGEPLCVGGWGSHYVIYRILFLISLYTWGASSRSLGIFYFHRHGWPKAFLDRLRGLGDELMHPEAYLDRLASTVTNLI